MAKARVTKNKDAGFAFERDLSRKLSLWVTGGARDDVLWRAAGSGGKAANARKRGTVQADMEGDIVSVCAEGAKFTERFVCELKTSKNLDWTSVLYGSKSTVVHSAWSGIREIGAATGKDPLLIARQTRRPALVGMTAHTGWCVAPDVRPLFYLHTPSDGEVRFWNLEQIMELVDFTSVLLAMDDRDSKRGRAWTLNRES